MNIVFVNHCHPEVRHVCGTRAREFAAALTRKGHRVLLLTGPLADEGSSVTPEGLAAGLAAHDFTAPYLLAAAPVDMPRLQRARVGGGGALTRRAILLWHYLVDGGVFADWRRGAAPFVPAIAEAFRPDVVWAIFGNTDCWSIGRDIARTVRCPWVADAKDFWSGFLPEGLRRVIARRFEDATAMTALSDSHGADARRWFQYPPVTVRSGFPAGWLAAANAAPEGFQISLSGSLYDGARLAELTDALARWLARRDGAAERVKLVYAGGDGTLFRTAVDRLGGLCEVEARDFQPLDELFALYRASRLNMYVRNERTFHHKVVELLAAGRPILAYPGEGEEALRLAAQTGGRLHAAATATDIEAALDDAAAGEMPDPAVGALDALTWDSQADALLAVLEAAAAGSPR